MDYQITTFVALGLFICSEVLPFVKKTKGEGLIHSLICLLRGSKCVVEKVLEVAESAIEKEVPDIV